MKASHSIVQFCNFHMICTNCSSCDSSSRKKKIILGVVYSTLVLLLVVAVYAATTITLHKAYIAPMSPSDLTCGDICPSDYYFQVDADRCCTSNDALSCKTKLQCKDWML